jgi:predicted GH43/DUF377 family glycosyl hydrolase
LLIVNSINVILFSSLLFNFTMKHQNMKTLLTFLFLISGYCGQSQCYISTYSGNQRVLKVDGDYVYTYSGNQRMYKFDGEYLVTYNTYKRLLKFDGQYIINYTTNKRIAKIDNQYLIDYTNNRRVAKLDCPGARSAMAAAAYFFL